MKRAFAAALALAATLWAVAPAVKRDSLAAVEKNFKQKLEGMQSEILSAPSGLYIPDYGAVFTSEVILAYTPTLNPFHLTITPEEKKDVLKRKQERLPVLRQNLRQLLLDSSATLDNLPANEQIVMSVTSFNYNWELTDGLPSQIQVRGMRSALLEAKAGKVPVDSVIRVQEQ